MSKNWLDEVSETERTPLPEQMKAMQERGLQLRSAYEDALEKYEQAKKAWEYFNHQEFPELLRSYGVEALTLADGTRVTIKTEAKCSLSKSKMDSIVAWLEEKGFPKIKRTVETDMSAVDTLKKYNIPYKENTAVNTQSVKAFVKRSLEANAMRRDEVHPGLNYFEFDTVVWE